MRKGNPANTCETNINDLLKSWDRYEIIDDENMFDSPKLKLIQSAGEENDGCEQEVGLVNISDLIEIVQQQLRGKQN